MTARFTVHKAQTGDWFYSYVDADGLLCVGYWETEAAARAVAEEHLGLADVAEPPKTL